MWVWVTISVCAVTFCARPSLFVPRSNVNIREHVLFKDPTWDSSRSRDHCQKRNSFALPVRVALQWSPQGNVKDIKADHFVQEKNIWPCMKMSRSIRPSFENTLNIQYTLAMYLIVLVIRCYKLNIQLYKMIFNIYLMLFIYRTTSMDMAKFSAAPRPWALRPSRPLRPRPLPQPAMAKRPGISSVRSLVSHECHTRRWRLTPNSRHLMPSWENDSVLAVLAPIFRILFWQKLHTFFFPRFVNMHRPETD